MYVKQLNDVNYQVSKDTESLIVHIEEIKPYSRRISAKEEESTHTD